MVSVAGAGSLRGEGEAGSCAELGNLATHEFGCGFKEAPIGSDENCFSGACWGNRSNLIAGWLESA